MFLLAGRKPRSRNNCFCLLGWGGVMLTFLALAYMVGAGPSGHDLKHARFDAQVGIVFGCFDMWRRCVSSSPFSVGQGVHGGSDGLASSFIRLLWSTCCVFGTAYHWKFLLSGHRLLWGMWFQHVRRHIPLPTAGQDMALVVG